MSNPLLASETLAADFTDNETIPLPSEYGETLPVHDDSAWPDNLGLNGLTEDEWRVVADEAWNAVMTDKAVNEAVEDQQDVEDVEDVMPPEILDAWNDVMADPNPDLLNQQDWRIQPQQMTSLPIQESCGSCHAGKPRAVKRVPLHYFSTDNFVNQHCFDMRTHTPQQGRFVTLKHAHSELVLAALLYMLQWMGYNLQDAVQQVFHRLTEEVPKNVVPHKRSRGTRVVTTPTMLRFLQADLIRALTEQGISTPDQLLAYWSALPPIHKSRLPHIIYLIIYMVFLSDELRVDEPRGRAHANAKRRSRAVLIRCLDKQDTERRAPIMITKSRINPLLYKSGAGGR